jgi:hypothetical protein
VKTLSPAVKREEEEEWGRRPRRSIADRRRKAPAARNVAGLIRSIDYSAMAALERALKSAPDEHGKIARALEGWREHSIYRLSLSDARLWPQSLQDADRLLDFFLLEKAFYEIEYELAYRLIGCGCRWPALGAFSWYAREYLRQAEHEAREQPQSVRTRRGAV